MQGPIACTLGQADDGEFRVVAPTIVRYRRRVDTRLDGKGRKIALRQGRLLDGETVWTIEATKDGITERMNLSDAAMGALAAAHAVLQADTLAPIVTREDAGGEGDPL